MKLTIHSIVLISILVIILLAIFVIGWRHAYPEATRSKGTRDIVPVEASTSVP
jgi:hypothetical protein